MKDYDELIDFVENNLGIKLYEALGIEKRIRK